MTPDRFIICNQSKISWVWSTEERLAGYVARMEENGNAYASFVHKLTEKHTYKT